MLLRLQTHTALNEYANYFASMTTNSLPVPEHITLPVTLQCNFDENRNLAGKIFTTSTIMTTLVDVPWNKAAGKSGCCYDLLKAAEITVISIISFWFRMLFIRGLVQFFWRLLLRRCRVVGCSRIVVAFFLVGNVG